MIKCLQEGGKYMKGEQNQIKKATEELAKSVETESMDKVLKKATKMGVFPKDLLGMSDSMVEGMYAQAYRLYNSGKYKEACELFRMLIMINALEPKYTMGFGACHHMLKEYKSAVDNYMLCSMLEPNSPIPYYHASDCYVQMGDPVSAIIELEMAIKRAGDRPEFKTLKDRALLTIESLKKELSKK
jgi:type III secretion system low calcium response chaperone LcrH/SycD